MGGTELRSLGVHSRRVAHRPSHYFLLFYNNCRRFPLAWVGGQSAPLGGVEGPVSLHSTPEPPAVSSRAPCVPCPCQAVCNGPAGPQGRGRVPSNLLGLTRWTFLLQLICLPVELVPFQKSLPGSFLNDLLSKIPYLTKISCILCLQYGLN